MCWVTFAHNYFFPSHLTEGGKAGCTHTLLHPCFCVAIVLTFPPTKFALREKGSGGGGLVPYTWLYLLAVSNRVSRSGQHSVFRPIYRSTYNQTTYIFIHGAACHECTVSRLSLNQFLRRKGKLKSAWISFSFPVVDSNLKTYFKGMFCRYEKNMPDEFASFCLCTRVWSQQLGCQNW